MWFAAYHSETLEVSFCCQQMEQSTIFTFLSQLIEKRRLCRDACVVWDGFETKSVTQT
jgi:hypothetical protein